MLIIVNTMMLVCGITAISLMAMEHDYFMSDGDGEVPSSESHVGPGQKIQQNLFLPVGQHMSLFYGNGSFEKATLSYTGDADIYFFTAAHRNWGLVCFLYLRNVKNFMWNHKRIYRIIEWRAKSKLFDATINVDLAHIQPGNPEQNAYVELARFDMTGSIKKFFYDV